jgi:hypothetical protein
LKDHPIGQRPSNPEEIVKAYLEHALKDPYSAHYEFVSESPGKLWGGAVNGGWVYGYLVVVNVNSKNSFGGYTGEQPWQFIIRDGVVTFAIPPESYHGLLM